jgi:hypothetical protein
LVSEEQNKQKVRIVHLLNLSIYRILAFKPFKFANRLGLEQKIPKSKIPKYGQGELQNKGFHRFQQEILGDSLEIYIL